MPNWVKMLSKANPQSFCETNTCYQSHGDMKIENEMHALDVEGKTETMITTKESTDFFFFLLIWILVLTKSGESVH